MRWDQANQALFIYASDYEALRTEQLAAIVTGDNTRLLSGTPIFQILNNVELPLAKSLGSSRVGAISFTSYFGPNVTEGLASIEKAESELNNIACIGYENGDRVLWGGAKRIPLPTLGMSITLNEIYDTLNVKPRPRLRVVRSDHTLVDRSPQPRAELVSIASMPPFRLVRDRCRDRHCAYSRCRLRSSPP